MIKHEINVVHSSEEHIVYRGFFIADDVVTNPGTFVLYYVRFLNGVTVKHKGSYDPIVLHCRYKDRIEFFKQTVDGLYNDRLKGITIS